ncbi:MAG: hypothetical protein CSB55_04735 [Candidatus Cloacimonadota bacterium]|nr:MAG: hypothetical protein CSB55_04735 [Candidatus Cloacimonadota bacterium]
MKKSVILILLTLFASGLFGQISYRDSVWYSYVDIDDAMATIAAGYPGEEYGLAIAFEIPEGQTFHPTKIELGLRQSCAANLNWTFIKFQDDYIIDEQIGDLTGVASFAGDGPINEFIYHQIDIDTDEVLEGWFAVKVMIPATNDSWYPCQQNSPYGHYNYAYYNGAWGRLEELWFPETSWCVSVGGYDNNTGTEEEIFPGSVQLYQNYPNPFNPKTTIKFYNNMSGNVKLTVYNTKGQVAAELVDGKMDAGLQYIDFDASALNSGVYYYRLETPGKTVTKKMILLK